MHRKRLIGYLGSALAVGALLAGCGNSNSSSSSSGAASSSAATTPTTKASASAPPAAAGAAPSEAQSAATGDIPDNQVFLNFHNSKEGYSIRYPEGWARKGTGATVTFNNHANVITVTVSKGAPPTPQSVSASLAAMKRGDPTINVGAPQQVTIAGSKVIKVTYTRQSSPDPVTGKRLPLTIDRYVYSHGGKVAVVDLGTPKGVDNVDAYRMISESFRWG